MSCRRVTVFGGTGFLGRRIVRHLQNADFAVRIVSRHPDRGRSLFSRDVSSIEPFRADVNDDGSVASAVSGACTVACERSGIRGRTVTLKVKFANFRIITRSQVDPSGCYVRTR